MDETLTGALERAAAPQEHKTIRELIERMQPELLKSLGRPEAVQALARHYLTAIRLNPKLLECSTESLLGALLLSAQVGLEPGPLGHVYLMPFKAECVWILGYTGIVELARRTGRVGALRAEVVWDCDEYEAWETETGPHMRFQAGPPPERKERRLAWCRWKERVGGSWLPQLVEVYPDRIERAKKASPAYQNQSGPWLTDESAMWRKTAVRAARPFLPLTAELAYAAASDDAILHGLDVDEAGAAQPVLEAPGHDEEV